MVDKTRQDEPLYGDDTISKIVEDIWFAARRGEADMRPYESRINQQVLQVLEQVKKKCIHELPSSSGENIPFVTLSDIEEIEKGYK